MEPSSIKQLINTTAFKRIQTLGLKINENQRKFDVLSIYNDLIDENAWSRLLAYLLNSKNFGAISKKLLINILGQPQQKVYDFAFLEKLLLNEETETVCALEWGTEENRRIDILIRLINKKYQTKAVIGIENKIDSIEQTNQICDYQNSLLKSFAGQIPKILIYLTPDGRKSLTADNNSKCLCYSFSYTDISKATSLIKEKSNSQSKIFISILNSYMDKTAQNEVINLKAQKLVQALFKEEKYRQAIKLINQYTPNLKGVFEEVTTELKTARCLPHTSSYYNHPKASLNPYEYKICVHELSEILISKKLSPHFILRCENQNPDYQDIFTLRIALWNENPKYKNASSKRELRTKIQSFISLSSVGLDKDWSQWICIYTGHSYKVSDFGKSDIKGFADLIKISVEEIYTELKEGLRRFSKSKL